MEVSSFVISVFATKIFVCCSKMSVELRCPLMGVSLFMQEIFCENKTHYNLRSIHEFIQPRVRTVNNGLESVTFKPMIRCSESLYQFKTKIKNWYGENCPCRLFRTFVPNDALLMMHIFRYLFLYCLILMVFKYFICHFYAIYVFFNVYTLELIS